MSVLLIDATAHRYGKLPSKLVGLRDKRRPDLWYQALAFDIEVGQKATRWHNEDVKRQLGISEVGDGLKAAEKFKGNNQALAAYAADRIAELPEDHPVRRYFDG